MLRECLGQVASNRNSKPPRAKLYPDLIHRCYPHGCPQGYPPPVLPRGPSNRQPEVKIPDPNDADGVCRYRHHRKIFLDLAVHAPGGLDYCPKVNRDKPLSA